MLPGFAVGPELQEGGGPPGAAGGGGALAPAAAMRLSCSWISFRLVTAATNPNSERLKDCLLWKGDSWQ